MKPFDRVPLRHAYTGMSVTVKGLMEAPAIIKVVEQFVQGRRPIDRLYALANNAGEWDFLELGLDRKGRVAEVRLMRQVEDAPTIAGEPAEVPYNGMTFKKPKKGSGRGYHIGRTNRYVDKGESQWVTYTAKVGDVTHLLVYATWEGGSGVYAGRIVAKKDATITIVEQRVRAQKK